MLASPESFEPRNYNPVHEKSIKQESLLRNNSKGLIGNIRRPVHKHADLKEYEEEKNEVICEELDHI